MREKKGLYKTPHAEGGSSSFGEAQGVSNGGGSTQKRLRAISEFQSLGHWKHAGQVGTVKGQKAR